MTTKEEIQAALNAELAILEPATSGNCAYLCSDGWNCGKNAAYTVGNNTFCAFHAPMENRRRKAIAGKKAIRELLILPLAEGQDGDCQQRNCWWRAIGIYAEDHSLICAIHADHIVNAVYANKKDSAYPIPASVRNG